MVEWDMGDYEFDYESGPFTSRLTMRPKKRTERAAPPGARLPHLCPVCAGRGMVSSAFYQLLSGSSSSTAVMTVDCRSCHGTGIVWEADRG